MVTAILHNIRSIHNVGSIFRTADGVGVEKLFLTGHTPTPIDRFGRKRQKFSKVALGAEETVEWNAADDIDDVIQEYKDNQVSVIACEPTTDAINVCEFQPDTDDICLVFGNEVDGLEETVIDRCHQIVQIPMQGKKSSLNVAVSFGILSFQVIDK